MDEHQMSVLDEIRAAIESVAVAAGPAVVGLGRRQRGSGIVIAPGRILTNAHNVRRDESTVTFSDGRTATGHVVGVDLDGDLAVLDVDTAGASPLAWGPDELLTVGTVVFGAAASPSGGTRLTFGTVSAVARAFRGPGGRRIEGSVEHTAPLAPGSSGGALLDTAGRLLGINTNRLGEGFYLARPADSALRAQVEALSRGESPTRPRLGVAVAPAHVARRLRRSVGLPERDGLLVRAVEEGSLAAAAGIAQGDLIVAVGSRPVSDSDELAAAIVAAAGGPYEVKVVRGTEERTVTIGASAPGRGGRRRTRGDA
jgi:S1-C subfamily serine protease